MRPVELEGRVDLTHVGGDDHTVDAARGEDLAHAAMGQAGLAQPEVFELIAQLLGAGQRPLVEIGMGDHLPPAPAAIPVGHISERGRTFPLHGVAPVRGKSLEQRVGRIAHRLGQRADAGARRLREAGAVAQGQRNGRHMHSCLFRDICQHNPWTIHGRAKKGARGKTQFY